MGLPLSAIVLCVSLLPGAAAIYLARIRAPLVLTLVLGWGSAAGLTVAVAAMGSLARHTTWLLGKSADGRIRPWSWLAFWPYHLGLRVKLVVGKWISREPLYNRILPGWYLGGWPNHPRHLPPSRNSCVVDVTCELPRTHTHKYLAVQVWDTCAPTLQQLQGAVDFARGEEQAGRSVYIHCAHGHGRSATVMCACLIECGHARSVEEAVAAMKSVRPLVHLSPPQRQVLDVWMQRRGALGSKGSSAHLNHLSHQGPNEESSSPLISPSLAREKAVTSPQGGVSMVKIEHDL